MREPTALLANFDLRVHEELSMWPRKEKDVETLKCPTHFHGTRLPKPRLSVQKIDKSQVVWFSPSFPSWKPPRLQFFTSIGGSTYDQWHGSGWDLDRNLRKPKKPQILNASKFHKIKRPLWTEESRTSGHSRILCGVPILKFCFRRVAKQRGISPYASKSSSSLSMADRLSKIWAGKHYEITKRVQLAPQNDPCFENLQSKLRISATRWIFFHLAYFSHQALRPTTLHDWTLISWHITGPTAIYHGQWCAAKLE